MGLCYKNRKFVRYFYLEIIAIFFSIFYNTFKALTEYYNLLMLFLDFKLFTFSTEVYENGSRQIESA